MRKLIMVLFLAMTTGCVTNQSDLQDGITCFRNENYRDAFVLLKPEAMDGQLEAAYAIGYMYYYGQGVVEDREKACYWINVAAKGGQVDAVNAIRIMKSC